MMTLKYKMENKTNGATITTNISYLPDWLARGFDIIEIIVPDEDKQMESSNNEEVGTI